MFTLAWCTGLRAGEILALNVADLDFTSRTINKSADDNNREIGDTKTETSNALLPLSSVLASVLQNYLEKAWRENPKRLLFPNRKRTHPMWRDNVVKYGLKPVLKKLGIPTKFVCTLSDTGWQPNSPTRTLRFLSCRNKCVMLMCALL